MKKMICLLTAVLMLVGAALAEVPGNKLGFDVLRELSDGTQNQIVSPLSLAYAMAMAAEGAQGDTRAEMLAALGVEDAEDVASLLYALAGSGLKQANAAFLPGEMVPREEYIAALEEMFGAEWFSPEESGVEDINRWVEEKTDGLIPEMLDKLPEEVQLVLLNAIAMDAQWQIKFKQQRNTEGVFYAPDGEQNVTYMNNEFYALYGERENVQLLQLDYRDCGLKLLIALPEEGGVEGVLNGLCAEGLDYFTFNNEEVMVDISMPKTDIEATNSLNDALKALGVEKAFSNNADFSGITEEMLLKISSVLQKARLVLYEEGTRAAAATMVSLEVYGMPMPEEMVDFRMDRPFVFVIADEASGAVCFAGIVSNPVGN